MRGSRPLGTAVALTIAALAPADRARPAAADEPVAADQEASEQPEQGAPTESDLSESPDRRIRKDWNKYDFKYLTFKWGVFTLLDWGTGLQSDAAAQQADVETDGKVRDFRFTFSGQFATERKVTYTMGLMYDGPTDRWFPRETGIQIAIPELWGNVFLGRQKEGISLNKITVGYAVWTMERMPINDASVPIMADGVKWLGVAPGKRANWNLAFFYNRLPKSPSTGWFDEAFVARFALLPMRPPEGEEANSPLLHLGLGYHRGNFSDDEAQLRARPESFTAPFFLDTGTFPADHNDLLVPEIYYRRGNWLFGGEYFFNFVHAPEVGNPLFHGGELFADWVITGETRPYVDIGGKLGFVKPASSAFDGGPGAWETVLHVSYTDLDDGDIEGGRFWRVTPQLNWYLDDLVSFRVNYGLGRLDRFGANEFTHFFQARLQLQIE